VYSFNTQVFSWDSNNWSGWNPFTTPWEVTGEPIFAISCNENWYGDTIDNPCAGGSTGLVSVGSAYVTSLQGYVMVPGFVKVPTTLDVSNMISAAISAYINSLNR